MINVIRLGALTVAVLGAGLVGTPPAAAEGPAVSINDVTVVEPNWPDWETPAVFTVSLNQPASDPVSVPWATSTPKDLWDPEIKQESGTVTIPAGQTQGTLTVTVLREDQYWGDREFTVSLSAPTNASIADGVGAGTIINTDRAGRFSCYANGGTARTTIAGITTNQGFGGGSGYIHECRYPDADTYRTVTHEVAGATITAKAFDLATSPTPNGNYSWDTRVNIGDGGDAHAKTGVITITGPGVDVRIETARSDATVRCSVLGVPPVMASSGAVTGVTINGTRIDKITDHRVYNLSGHFRLEFNRQTTKTENDPVPWVRLAQDAVVIQNGVLVYGHTQVGYLHQPCTA